MRMIKKTNVKYLLEVLIVAFGVFLGLFISEWNTQRKANINTENTMVHIISELESNIIKFEKAINYHHQLGTEFDSVVKRIENIDLDDVYYNNTQFKHYNLPSWNGMGFVVTENVIYESAKISGVLQELNITTIQRIANIYKDLESYSESTKTSLNKLITIDSSTKIADIYKILELLKIDALNYEKYILEELKITVNELKETIHNNVYKK